MHFNLLLILTPCLSFSPLSIHPSTSPADLYMFILTLLPVSVNAMYDNEGSDSFSQLCRFASGCIVLYPVFMSSTTIRTGFVLSSPPLSHWNNINKIIAKVNFHQRTPTYSVSLLLFLFEPLRTMSFRLIVSSILLMYQKRPKILVLSSPIIP